MTGLRQETGSCFLLDAILVVDLRHPGLSIAGRSTGHQTEQVDMPAEVLSPGMQDGRHAQFTVQAFFVCRKGFQCVPYGCKQTLVYDIVMALHPGVQLMGQGKDQVVVWHAIDYPSFGNTP